MSKGSSIFVRQTDPYGAQTEESSGLDIVYDVNELRQRWTMVIGAREVWVFELKNSSGRFTEPPTFLVLLKACSIGGDQTFRVHRLIESVPC